MKRWVGLGVIADNLISMGNARAEQANPSGPFAAHPVDDLPPAAASGNFLLFAGRAHARDGHFPPESS